MSFERQATRGSRQNGQKTRESLLSISINQILVLTGHSMLANLMRNERFKEEGQRVNAKAGLIDQQVHLQ